MKVTGWCAIAGTATVVMVGFFSAALFLWMAEWSGRLSPAWCSAAFSS
jgi:hypothetical protein